MNRHIYISGALFMSHNLADQRALYEFAESICNASGHNAYVPHKHTDPELRADADPVDIYKIDSQKVLTAKAVVAFANEPSFGAGMEIMLAVQNNIPVIVYHQNTVKVSRYLRGLLLSHDYADVQAYKDQADLKSKLQQWLVTTFAQAT